jgi:hypothetical protein
MHQHPIKTRSEPARRWLVALATVAMVTLAGCQGLTERSARACPSVVILGNTNMVTKFAPVGAAASILAEATLSALNSGCRANEERVLVEIAFQIDAVRGLSSDVLEVEIPFFAAVTDAEGSILAKDIFIARLEFSETGTATVMERIEEDIRLAPGQAPVGFQIVVGFQLTPEEMRYSQTR